MASMPYELDHIFILAAPGAPEAEQLIGLGLSEGAPNVHPGQGTANRRFFFHNAMLELIFVTDEAEARSALVTPTRLWERSRWRQTAACPFGLCLRATGDDPPPFPTTEYRPPYLPPGVAIPIARGTMAVEPMLFVNPVGERPATFPPERRQPIEHPLGVRELTGVHVVSAGCELPSDPLRAVQRMGIASFSQGEGHLIELTFDAGEWGRSADLRPELPLLLCW
jgi:hypothetical protein